MSYLWMVLIAVDQLANSAFGWLFNWCLWGRLGHQGPFGCPDETISSVLGKLQYLPHVAERCPMAMKLASFLDWLDPGHCKRSVEWCQGWTLIQIEVTAGEMA